MLARRIIPCLDVRAGRVVKGVRFVELSDAGDPVELARVYEARGADELVFLDITATVEGRKAMRDVVSVVAAELTIPFAVGGGVHGVVGETYRSTAPRFERRTSYARPPTISVVSASSWRSMHAGTSQATDGKSLSTADGHQPAAMPLRGRPRARGSAPARFCSRGALPRGRR